MANAHPRVAILAPLGIGHLQSGTEVCRATGKVAYLQSAHDLVLGKDSVARLVSQAPFEALPYCLSFKCDGCLYNEFCMKWSAERETVVVGGLAAAAAFVIAKAIG